MNRVTVTFLVLATLLSISGLYLINPPLALVAGGLVCAMIGGLFWEVDE